MKIVRVTTLIIDEGQFKLNFLMRDIESGETIYKIKPISDSFALSIIKTNNPLGAITSRYSRSI